MPNLIAKAAPKGGTLIPLAFRSALHRETQTAWLRGIGLSFHVDRHGEEFATIGLLSGPRAKWDDMDQIVVGWDGKRAQVGCLVSFQPIGSYARPTSMAVAIRRALWRLCDHKAHEWRDPVAELQAGA